MNIFKSVSLSIRFIDNTKPRLIIVASLTEFASSSALWWKRTCIRLTEQLIVFSSYELSTCPDFCLFLYDSYDVSDLLKCNTT